MDTPIPRAFGTPYLQRTLARAGLTTLQSLAAKTRKEMRWTDGVGPVAAALIAELLRDHGLEFRECTQQRVRAPKIAL